MGNSIYNSIDRIVDNAIIPSFLVSFVWLVIKHIQYHFGRQWWWSFGSFVILVFVMIAIQCFASYVWNKLKERCPKISLIFSETMDNFDISNSLKINLKGKEDPKSLFIQVFADGYRKQTSKSKPIVVSFAPISVDLAYDKEIAKKRDKLFYEIISEKKQLRIYPNKLFGDKGCNNSRYIIKLIIQPDGESVESTKLVCKRSESYFGMWKTNANKVEIIKGGE